MRQFMLGIILGSVLTALGVQAQGKDALGRSPQQQKYDYYRERALQLDVESIRRADENRRMRNLGRIPCER